MKLSQLRRLKALDTFTSIAICDALELPLTYNTCSAVLTYPEFLAELLRILSRLQGAEYDYCSHCQGFGLAEEGMTTHDDDFLCLCCYEEDFFTSDRSGGVCHTNDTRQVIVDSEGNTETWSLDEATDYGWKCADCGDYYSDRMICYDTDEDTLICSHCADTNWSSCDDCNQFTRNAHTADSERTICQDCISDYAFCDACDTYPHESYNCDNYDEDESSSCIRPYSSRVENDKSWGTPIAKGHYLRKKQARLFMGTELEVEARKDASKYDLAKEVLEATEHGVYCCEDGSLSNGFEIKTAPQNLEETKEIFNQILGMPHIAQLRSHDGGNCGLHINLSREGLSQMQQAKLMFFYNSAVNKKFLLLICRRFSTESYVNDHTNYAVAAGNPKLSAVVRAWSRGYSCDYNKPNTAYCNHRSHGKVHSKLGTVNCSRYSAVNFCDEKVEIRLPRGTLNRNTLMANLELAVALTEFTRTGEENAGSGRYATEFICWMQAYPGINKAYPELTRFCVDRHLLPGSILPKPLPEPPPLEECPAYSEPLMTPVSRPLTEDEISTWTVPTLSFYRNSLALTLSQRKSLFAYDCQHNRAPTAAELQDLLDCGVTLCFEELTSLEQGSKQERGLSAIQWGQGRMPQRLDIVGLWSIKDLVSLQDLLDLTPIQRTRLANHARRNPTPIQHAA